MHIAWEDLQTIEVLVRVGTIAGAGRELGLRHTSVGRRVDALERALQLPLFLRGGRLEPTALARELAARAGRMAKEANDVAALVEDARRQRERRLVVTTNDVLAPLLFAALARRRDGPRVEVRVADVEEPLTPGVVDLALRPSSQPAGALRGWRLGRLRVGVYVAGNARGTKAWVSPTDELRGRASMRWWKVVPADAPGSVTCGALTSMRDACAAGLGRAALPTLMGDADGRLVREALVEGSAPVWLLASATRRSEPALQREALTLAEAMRAVRGVWE